MTISFQQPEDVICDNILSATRTQPDLNLALVPEPVPEPVLEPPVQCGTGIRTGTSHGTVTRTGTRLYHWYLSRKYA